MGNINHASINHFLLVFNGFPEVEFMVKSLVFPSLDVPPVEVSLPTSTLQQPGNKLVYTPLTIVYYLDEDWKTYGSLRDWLLTFADDSGGFQETPVQFQDASVVLYDNHKEVTGRLFFNDMFPTSVEGPTLDTSVDAYTDIELTATFGYSGMDFQRKTE